MIVYHVTPCYNLESIFQRGVNPAYSHGAEKCCWFVSQEKLTWAIKHVSRKWDVEECDVVVIMFAGTPDEFRKRQEGVFTCSEIVEWKRFLRLSPGSFEGEAIR